MHNIYCTYLVIIDTQACVSCVRAFLPLGEYLQFLTENKYIGLVLLIQDSKINCLPLLLKRTKHIYYGKISILIRFRIADYATESCGHVLGPDQLSVLQFDKEVDYDKKQPSTEQDLMPPMEIR